MKWIKEFQLFLFDFDGLLVNTENVHYQAYINMCKRRGFNLDWSFLKFCEVAHFDDESLKEGIYALFPDLLNQESNWNVLRCEKNRIYMDLIQSAKIDILPGVEKLLKTLDKENISSCVVTNSSKEMIDGIISSLDILKTIPHWVTREQYIKPKPSPECYLRAIELYSKKGDRCIGFEDSLRGLKALKETPAQAVLISPLYNPEAEVAITHDVFHFATMDDFIQAG